MAASGETIRFHHSARSLVVTCVVLFLMLIPLGLTVGELPGWGGGISPDHLGVGLAFYLVLAIGLVLVGRATNTTRWTARRSGERPHSASASASLHHPPSITSTR